MAIHNFNKIHKSIIACLCIMGLGLGMVNFPIRALEYPESGTELHESTLVAPGTGVLGSIASAQSDIIAVPDTTLRKLSFRNFGIANATFTGIGDLNAVGSYLGSLDGTIFSGNITFSGSAQKDIRLGGIGGYWYGLRFYNSGPNICMQDVQGNTSEYIFTPTIAQTAFQDIKFNLKVSFQFVDSDIDGTKDDVKLGVWFNNTLYNNSYIYLKNYAPLLGSKLGVYVGNANSSLAIESDALSEAKTPDESLKKITFFNFGISNNTYQYTGDISANGQRPGSLDGTKFSGDVTFTGPSSSDIRYGGDKMWYGLRFYNLGENLYMKDVGDKTAEYGFTSAMAGTQLIGAKFNLKITTQFIDADNDGTSDDVKLGVWFNDVLYENNYIYLMNYAIYMGNYIGIFVSSINSSLTAASVLSEGNPEIMDPSLQTITFRNFNIADGSYYYNNNDLSVKGRYNGTLNGTVFSGFMTFSGAQGEQLRFAGKESEWHGLLFGSNGDGTLYLAEATELFPKIVIFPEMAGTPLTVERLNLKFSLQFVDSDMDGIADDVKLGVWFNDSLYANEYFYLTDYAYHIGNWMSLYIFNSENTQVDLESLPYGTLDSLTLGFNMVSFKKFHIADGKYYANGDLSIKGTYSMSLDQSVFSANVLYSGRGVEEIRFYGKEDGWYGLRFFSKGDGNLYLSDEPALNPEYVFSPGIAGTKLTGERFNLKLSISFVDHDNDGKKDDIQLGVWFNDRLYANEYFYYIDYVSILGNYIGIYIPGDDSFVEIQSVIKPVDFSIFGLSANWENELFGINGSGKSPQSSGEIDNNSSPNTSDSGEPTWWLLLCSLFVIALLRRTDCLRRKRELSKFKGYK